MIADDIWRASVTYDSTAPLTHDQVQALAAQSPGAQVEIRQDKRGTHLSFTVQADRCVIALDMALDAARQAWVAVFGVVGQVASLQAMREAVHQDQVAHPDPIDLVGVSEITDMIAQRGAPVTRQRAQQITVSQGFPEPVATLKATKVYTRGSVDLFLDWWPRVSGAHRPANAAAAGIGEA